MDGQTDGQTNKQMNRWNYTNLERNLAMMVIYVTVKYESIGQTIFELESGKRKCGQTDGQTNGTKNRQTNRWN